ncbi:transglycosylase domain-containing protein [Shinella sumterensis]|uniref:transglycosylase domain-containing protein n=1 Tax=Shinella sumterensis TaxID=1967501 RepID=UPI003F8490C3
MIRKITRRTFSLLLVAFVSLAFYEGWRVWVAHQRVDALFAPYRSVENSGILRWHDLTSWQQKALIQVEDPGFFQHNGVDMWTAGAGLTSITQAITKRLFFEQFRPGFAKIEQSLIARYVISPNVSKEDQLTTFLNVAYLGESNGKAIVGFPMAARAYFNKDVADLNDTEFLRLVGALLAPRTYPPIPGNRDSDVRLSRLQHYVAGVCKPTANGDVTLSTC